MRRGVMMFCRSRAISGYFMLGAVLLFSMPAISLDVALTYERFPEQLEKYQPRGGAGLVLGTTAPQGKWKLPDFKGKLPLYSEVKLGSRTHLLVLVRQKEKDPIYNRAYFDANANGDLTDDPVIDARVAESEDNRCNGVFPIVDLKIDSDGKSVPYSFRLSANTWDVEELRQSKDPGQFIHVMLWVNCCYRGSFSLDGQAYQVALGDGNGNGQFDDKVRREDVQTPDRAPIFWRGDLLCLTTSEEMGYRDEGLCSHFLGIKDKVFEVAINIPENRMTLTPATVPLVPLKLPVEPERLTLVSEDGARSLMFFQPGAAVQVPASKYRLVLYQLLRKDPQGDSWLLSATSTKESPVIAVEAAGDTVFPFGEPFLPLVDVPEDSRRDVAAGGTSAKLAFYVVGAGKELITDLAALSTLKTAIALSEKQPNRPKEPAYRVLTADGEIVAQGRFEYG